MNPIEYFDTLEKIELKKIHEDSKTEYTKDEVMFLLKQIGLQYRKAIYNGEYVFDIETLDKQTIEVKDTEYAIQKLVTHDNKYLLFMQITNALDEDLTQSDIQIIAEEMYKAANKSNNIAGVMLLPPNVEISLITAKLEPLSYTTEELYFSFEELDEELEFSTIYKNTLNNMITKNTDINGEDLDRLIQTLKKGIKKYSNSTRNSTLENYFY